MRKEIFIFISSSIYYGAHIDITQYYNCHLSFYEKQLIFESIFIQQMHSFQTGTFKFGFRAKT